MDEVKIIVILLIFVVGIPMTGMVINDYHKSQCRIAAIQSNMPPEQIEKVCK